MVAAASHNGSVYLYRVSRDGFSYKKEAKLSGQGGQQLTHLDWDEAGRYIVTCSADYTQAGGGGPYWAVKTLYSLSEWST
jgi:hypothetical protein